MSRLVKVLLSWKPQDRFSQDEAHMVADIPPITSAKTIECGY